MKPPTSIPINFMFSYYYIDGIFFGKVVRRKTRAVTKGSHKRRTAIDWLLFPIIGIARSFDQLIRVAAWKILHGELRNKIFERIFWLVKPVNKTNMQIGIGTWGFDLFCFCRHVIVVEMSRKNIPCKLISEILGFRFERPNPFRLFQAQKQARRIERGNRAFYYHFFFSKKK